MKFYNREYELVFLEQVASRTIQSAQFTLMLGRRRVGKTRLLHKAFENKKSVYFFVAKKSEPMLCAEYVELIKSNLNIPVFGEFTSFKSVFELLMHASVDNPFTVIIDEFQEFTNINKSVYSEMQNVWDTYKEKSRLNLVVCGSIYSLMKQIFENSKEPLFGRATDKIIIKPFGIDIQKQILKDINPDYLPKDLLAFYAVTGGMAKYVEVLAERNAVTFDTILDEILRKDSLLISEGKNLLIEEMGRDYITYFSILTLIASSKTSRSEIESVLQKDIGGYLEKLENDYTIIRKVKPLLAKPQSRSVKYFIDDNFLNFWFRFIYKNSSSIEIENFEYVKEVVRSDFDSFSGKLLEKYFREKLILESNYSEIGSYWERGNKNEIDIVAINKRKKIALIIDIKLNPAKINLDALKIKAQNLVTQLTDYQIEYTGWSLEDI
ncbi:MAG: ATP-binding protein [Salinivirgaceae bacterium]|nr:ATP-binding protein [Salinivirgaceae bacterium]